MVMPAPKTLPKAAPKTLPKAPQSDLKFFRQSSKESYQTNVAPQAFEPEEAGFIVAVKMLKEKAEAIVLKLSEGRLQWSDVEPLLEQMYSQEELQEAVNNPESFFTEFFAAAGGIVAVKIVLPELKSAFEPVLQPFGLNWEDVQPVFEMVDSRAELEEAKSNPKEFFKKLRKQGGPAIEKIKQKIAAHFAPLIKELKEKAERILYELSDGRVQWSDVEPLLEQVDSAEELDDAIKDPKTFFKKFLAAVGGIVAVKFLLPELKRKFTPVLEPHGLTWEDFEPVIEKIDSAAELKEAQEDPPAFLKKLLTQGGPEIEKLKLIMMAKMGEKAMDMMSDLGIDRGAMEGALEIANLADKLRKGEISCEDLMLQMSEGEDPEFLKSKLMSFGMDLGLADQFADMKDKMESQAEAFGVPGELIGIATGGGGGGIVKSMCRRSKANRAQMFAHRPELCNELWGAYLLEICDRWEGLLYPWKKILGGNHLEKDSVGELVYHDGEGSLKTKKTNAFVRHLCRFLVPLICAFAGPIWYICFEQDTGTPTHPLKRFSAFTASDYPFFAVVLFLPIGISQAYRLVINNMDCEIPGSMIARLHRYYEPGVPDKELFEKWHSRSEAAEDHSVMALTRASTYKHIVAKIKVRSRLLFRLYAFAVPMGCFGAVIFPLIFSFIDKTGVTLYWIAHKVCYCVLVFSLFSLVICSALLLIVTCNLLETNINAYKELVDSFCLQVDMISQKENEKFKKTKEKHRGLDQKKYVSDMVVNHPVVCALKEQVVQYEEYLVDMAKLVTKGEMGSIANFGYGIICITYVFLALYIYIVIQETRITKNLSKMGVAFGVVIGVLWSLVIVCQPLIAMAKQAQAWIKLTKTFKTEARQRVSEILSPKNDAFFFFNKYDKLTDNFTWNILGAQIHISAITKAVTSYASVVFASMILPALQDYTDELKARVEEELHTLKNQTMAKLNSTKAEFLSYGEM